MTSQPARAGTAPFEHNHADPWATHFVDLPTLNQRASDAIVGAIESVTTAARQGDTELRSKSLLILGSAGAGKTHLFARIRRRLGPRAVFVLIRPLIGTEMTPRYVLGEIIAHLNKDSVTPNGVPFRQLDTLVGASLAHLDGYPPNMPRVFLDECAQKDEVKRAKLLDDALEKLLDRYPDLDETYLARLLRTPFMPRPTQRAALAWLAGRELEEAQMSRLGVTEPLREERIVRALQTLGIFAAPGAPIVLVFDQLENLVDPEGTPARVRAYANLVSELFDTMRGFVLVQMALDTEWKAAIEPALPLSQRTRMAAQTELIALPKPDEARELLRLWTEQIPDRPEPFPWPFGDRRVKRWCETPGMTPRMLMIACKQALAEGPGDDPEEPTTDAVEAAPPTERGRPWIDEIEARRDALVDAWREHVELARKALDEADADRRGADPARLIGGIACALRFADGAKVGRMDARGPIHVEVDGADGSRRGICILHQAHPRSTVAVLDKIADAMTGPKARSVVVVRERALEFPPTWKQTLAKQEAIIRQGARWEWLERDEAVNLLALESFVAAARSHDIEDAQGHVIDEVDVMSWIRQELAVKSWPPLRAIVGAGARPDGEDALVESGAPSSDGAQEQNARDAGQDAGAAKSSDAAKGDIGGATAAIIRACLANLRVASLERLVREVVRVRPSATRAEVVASLEQMADDVTWFGRSILAFTKTRAAQAGRSQAPTTPEEHA